MIAYLKHIVRMIFCGVVMLSGGYAHASTSPTLYMQGFPQAEYELMINPCISLEVLQKKFGEKAVKLAYQIRQKYPADLCGYPEIISMLAEWNANSSMLLAATERPFIIEPMIKENNAVLLMCNTVTCLSRHLPMVVEWSRTTLNRTPVASKDLHTLSTTSSPIAHPQLALRDFPLPLSGQEAICHSSSMQALKFASSSMIVSGRAVAFVTCKNANQKVSWLVERCNRQWREILSLPGVSDISVLPQNREVYPNIFYTKPIPDGEQVTLLEYKEGGGYQEKMGFDVVKNASGVEFAFKVRYIVPKATNENK